MRFEKAESLEKMIELLVRYDDSAVRTISSRTGDLKQYARKLFRHAENFILSDGDKEIGFVSFYGNDAVNQMIYLTIIAIRPQFKGHGFGTAVLNDLERFGREHGRKKIKLEVDKDNTDAVCFYRKNGFRITEEASAESVFMEKEISYV